MSKIIHLAPQFSKLRDLANCRICSRYSPFLQLLLQRGSFVLCFPQLRLAQSVPTTTRTWSAPLPSSERRATSWPWYYCRLCTRTKRSCAVGETCGRPRGTSEPKLSPGVFPLLVSFFFGFCGLSCPRTMRLGPFHRGKSRARITCHPHGTSNVLHPMRIPCASPTTAHEHERNTRKYIR